MDPRALPFLGVGLGYRAELDPAIAAARAEVDWLEVISEHYLSGTAERTTRLRELGRRFPIVPHGIEMSIGTEGALDGDYVERLARLVEAVKPPWFSDHLCFTRAGGIALGQLTPLRRTRGAAAAIATKAKEVQERVGAPLLLENITYYVDLAGELAEAEFLGEVVERAGCGILLDVTNLSINARNHGFDPIAWLEAIPRERVVQLHLAGRHEGKDIVLDTHGAAVAEEVWALLAEVVRRCPHLKAVLIERDQNYPAEFGELLDEVRRARRALAEARRDD
jgi:uncharacterized protein (UPF0276 family)